MTKVKLNELSVEELEQKAKKTKLFAGMLTGLCIVLYIVTIYSSIRKGEFDYMMLLPIALTFTLISNFQQVKKIEEEIKNRK